MNRQKAREYMMTVLFQMEAMNDFNVDEIDHYLNNEVRGIKLGNQKKYCEDVYSLICNKVNEIDNLIASNSKKWNITRTPKTDLAILRLATLEIMYIDEIPDSVSINEAVELAKTYCEDNAPSYINGILGAISRGKEE